MIRAALLLFVVAIGVAHGLRYLRPQRLNHLPSGDGVMRAQFEREAMAPKIKMLKRLA